MATYSTGDLTKQKIFEVAREVFYEFGYLNATLKEISSRANVKQSAISYHFKDKKELAKLIYSDFGERHSKMVKGEIQKNRYTDDLIIRTITCSAVFLLNSFEDPNLNRYWAEMYLNTYPIEIEFFQNQYKAMFEKRNLDPGSSRFQFFMISNTYLTGSLLQGYLNHTLTATQDEILKYKLSRTLWELNYTPEESDALIEEIFEISKKITVHAGKNFEIYYEND